MEIGKFLLVYPEKYYFQLFAKNNNDVFRIRYTYLVNKVVDFFQNLRQDLKHHQRHLGIAKIVKGNFKLIHLLPVFPGSTDVDIPSSLLHTMQNQMQSKGGYEMAYGVKVRKLQIT